MTGTARVIVVDDELPVCKSVCKALEREDYTVETALSGEEAIEKSRERPYDVVITDLMMPGISGMELLETIRKETPGTVVIMITGYPSITSAVEALKRGAFDYIPKPFTPAELRSLVSRALASRVSGDRSRIKPPQGTYCIPDNSWVRLDEKRNALIGVHPAFLDGIGTIVDVELPGAGQMRYQGEACIRITDDSGHIHRVWTPISGRVIETNRDIEPDYSVVRDDPYGAGWLILLAPTNLGIEIPLLADAGSHRRT
jgi:CheY-like chemotaxis protein/glycine cleavage system H lipoate-binding protein